MLKKVLLGLAAVLVVLVAVIAMRPGKYRVERAATINAPAEVIFAQINDIHQWDHWSPWAKRGPNEKVSYSGPAAGVGSVQSWTGNEHAGDGRITIMESKPNERVALKLEFIQPWEMTSSLDFALTAEKDAVRVIWGMEGAYDFIGKAMSLFTDMDQMVGGDFEKGLAGLKTVTEAEAKRLKEEAEAKAAAEKAAAEGEGAPAPVVAVPANE